MLKKFIFLVLFLLLFFIFFFSSCFAMSPSSNTIYEGIDVSNWQGYIDFSRVKASGIDIVYIKSSQGSNITDSFFKVNYNNAKANGLKVGFYHFLTARSEEEAINEAKYFSSVISGTSPDCKLAMDFESFGNLSKTEINNISFVFMSKVKELTGKDVIIYSDAYNAESTFGKELANAYPLWIAEYDVLEPADNTNWNYWIRFSIH